MESGARTGKENKHVNTITTAQIAHIKGTNK